MTSETLFFRFGPSYGWELHSEAFQARLPSPRHLILKALSEHALENGLGTINAAACEVTEKWHDRGGEMQISFGVQDWTKIQTLMGRCRNSEYVMLFQAINKFRGLTEERRPAPSPRRSAPRPSLGGG